VRIIILAREFLAFIVRSPPLTGAPFRAPFAMPTYHIVTLTKSSLSAELCSSTDLKGS